MVLSKLAAKCQACPHVDSCDHKRMEIIGFLEPTAAQSDLQESLIIPHDYRQVKIAPSATSTIDIEEFKKEVEKSIAKYVGLYGGFFQNCTCPTTAPHWEKRRHDGAKSRQQFDNYNFADRRDLSSSNSKP